MSALHTYTHYLPAFTQVRIESRQKKWRHFELANFILQKQCLKACCEANVRSRMQHRGQGDQMSL
jgi:hypothetical protein